MNRWELLLALVSQVFAAYKAIEAKGGHGTYEFDLDVRDKATGTDIIAGVEVAEITL